MNKTSYNKIAKEWEKIRDNALICKPIIEFAEKIKPQGNILDIGCGTGNPITRYLSEQNFKMIGIDIAESMIEIAKYNEILNAEFICCDFSDFNSTEKFDGIIAWDSLFHLPKEKQKSAYPKLASLLNINGYLLFTHGKNENELIDTMMNEKFYYSSLSKQNVIEILKENGFEIVYAHEDYKELNTHRELVILAKKTTIANTY